MGATVLFTGRSQEKANAIISRATLLTKSDILKKLIFKKCDFTDFSDVLSVVESIKRESGGKLNILMNNAGLTSATKKTTKDSCDLVVQTNHLSPFLLTSELLSLLNKTPNSRIVCLSSIASEDKGMLSKGLMLKDFNWETTPYEQMGFNNYSTTKYYNMIFAETLNLYIEKENMKIKVASCHPGWVLTDWSNNAPKYLIPLFNFLIPISDLFAKDLKYGYSTQMHCSTVELKELVSGSYYADCVVKQDRKTPKDMLTKESGIAVWNKTIEVIENRIGKKLTGLSKL